MIERVPVVGPRELPAAGPVRVWVDSGSGSGHEIHVPAEHLDLSKDDDGRSASAIYALRVRECRG
jgi:hypothetical protein